MALPEPRNRRRVERSETHPRFHHRGTEDTEKKKKASTRRTQRVRRGREGVHTQRLVGFPLCLCGEKGMSVMDFATLNPFYGPTSRRRFIRGLAAAGSLPLLRRMNAMAAPAMITRPIPPSGEAMSVIGLGTWSVFDTGEDPAART